MRREVLYHAISRINEDLKACGIAELFDGFFNEIRSNAGKERERYKLPLGIFQKYMIATHDYDENQKEICRLIGIGNLLDVSYWEDLAQPSNVGELHETLQNVHFALKQLPKIMQLVKQDYVGEIKGQEGEIPEELKGKSLLTVLIVEDKGQYSSPLRLTSALEAIYKLYSVVATLEKQNESDLIVLACDSGSDKSFDFLGLAKLMEQVKEILVAIWDRRVFYRQRHVSESMTLIAESLPILEKIEELRVNGSIEPEQAELLKRKTISGATQFIEAGATIPEFEAESTHNPKQLMKPEPKLLVSPRVDDSPTKNGAKADDTEGGDEETSSGNLSNKEAQMLELLMKKSQEKTKKKKTQRTTKGT